MIKDINQLINTTASKRIDFNFVPKHQEKKKGRNIQENAKVLDGGVG